uniref:Ciliogenesis-associated TTC17-interacting protein n=1 Tax=Otus sunia TaxID=257818 RepID=A0A8C8A7X9_9STRI
MARGSAQPARGLRWGGEVPRAGLTVPGAGPEELERCLFAETLEVVAAGGQPRDRARGRWWLSARWAPYERAGEPARSCLLVQAGSRSRQDGAPGSRTLKGGSGAALGGGPPPPQGWGALLQCQRGGLSVALLCQLTFSYGQAELRGLLPEGANLLLLRVLACRRAVPPDLVFPAIDTEGHLCTSSYRALGVQQQAVGLAEAEVFVIERAMHTATGVSTIWHSSFLPSGYGGSSRGTPCPAFLLPGGAKPRPPFPKQPLDWEEDLQLHSWFLDRKEELQASHAAYIQQHPELWVLLADFLQALLLQQPHDPVSFAAQFFARQQPPSTPFASTGAASPVPNPLPHHPPANGE